MKNFRLSPEFEPGVYIGSVYVEIFDETHDETGPPVASYWIVPPGLRDSTFKSMELPTDAFVDVTVDPEGNWMVDRFSRNVSKLENPIPCWTNERVVTFVTESVMR